MLNLDKNVIILVIAIFAFQLLFPQYACAQEIDIDDITASQSELAIVNLPEPILINGSERGIFYPLPEADSRAPFKKAIITITAYSSTVDQCDASPFITANGSQVEDGIVAANFLPFGAKVKIPELFGDKVFSVEDRMNRRYQHRMDVWMETREEAIQFGVKRVEVEIY